MPKIQLHFVNNPSIMDIGRELNETSHTSDLYDRNLPFCNLHSRYRADKVKILTYPDPKLTTRARKVFPEEFGDDLARVSVKMLEIMRDAGGVGLAANQIGDDRAILVAEWEGSSITLVNPVLIGVTGEIFYNMEGCLSVPGCQVLKGRMDTIIVQYHLPHIPDRQFVTTFDGHLSRAIQHELDHLEGRLIAYPQTQRSIKRL